MFSGDALKEPKSTTVMFLLLFLKRLNKSSVSYIHYTMTIIMDNVHDYILIELLSNLGYH